MMAQLFGTVAIVLMALGLFDIGLSRRFCRYAREALVCTATFLFLVAGIRLLAQYEAISHVHAREVNGLLAIPFLAILLDVVYLHWVYHRGQRGRG